MQYRELKDLSAKSRLTERTAAAPESALRVPPGKHEITVTKNGYEPWTRTVEVTAGSELAVHADMTAKTAAQEHKEIHSEQESELSVILHDGAGP